MKPALVGRLADIASGNTELPPTTVNRYLSLFSQYGFEIPENAASRLGTVKRELVGTALKHRISGMLRLKSKSGCGCMSLAAEMDQWGIAGCEKRREYIVKKLMANRSMLVDAISSEAIVHSVIGWVAKTFVADAILMAGANWFLTQAIEDVRQQSKHSID